MIVSLALNTLLLRITSLSKWYIPILDPSDLVGRSILLNKEDGKRLRERIVKVLDYYDRDLARDSSRMTFFAI